MTSKAYYRFLYFGAFILIGLVVLSSDTTLTNAQSSSNNPEQQTEDDISVLNFIFAIDMSASMSEAIQSSRGGRRANDAGLQSLPSQLVPPSDPDQLRISTIRSLLFWLRDVQREQQERLGETITVNVSVVMFAGSAEIVQSWTQLNALDSTTFLNSTPNLEPDSDFIFLYEQINGLVSVAPEPVTGVAKNILYVITDSVPCSIRSDTLDPNNSNKRIRNAHHCINGTSSTDSYYAPHIEVALRQVESPLQQHILYLRTGNYDWNDIFPEVDEAWKDNLGESGELVSFNDAQRVFAWLLNSILNETKNMLGLRNDTDFRRFGVVTYRSNAFEIPDFHNSVSMIVLTSDKNTALSSNDRPLTPVLDNDRVKVLLLSDLTQRSSPVLMDGVAVLSHQETMAAVFFPSRPSLTIESSGIQFDPFNIIYRIDGNGNHNRLNIRVALKTPDDKRIPLILTHQRNGIYQATYTPEMAGIYSVESIEVAYDEDIIYNFLAVPTSLPSQTIQVLSYEFQLLEQETQLVVNGRDIPRSSELEAIVSFFQDARQVSPPENIVASVQFTAPEGGNCPIQQSTDGIVLTAQQQADELTIYRARITLPEAGDCIATAIVKATEFPNSTTNPVSVNSNQISFKISTTYRLLWRLLDSLDSVIDPDSPITLENWRYLPFGGEQETVNLQLSFIDENNQPHHPKFESGNNDLVPFTAALRSLDGQITEEISVEKNPIAGYYNVSFDVPKVGSYELIINLAQNPDLALDRQEFEYVASINSHQPFALKVNQSPIEKIILGVLFILVLLTVLAIAWKLFVLRFRITTGLIIYAITQADLDEYHKRYSTDIDIDTQQSTFQRIPVDAPPKKWIVWETDFAKNVIRQNFTIDKGVLLPIGINQVKVTMKRDGFFTPSDSVYANFTGRIFDIETGKPELLARLTPEITDLHNEEAQRILAELKVVYYIVKKRGGDIPTTLQELLSRHLKDNQE